MPRSIGTIEAARYADKNLYYWHCVRIDWSVSAVDRFSTYPVGDSLVLDVEGTGGAPQTWDCTVPWTPGDYEQGDQTSLSISDIAFGNADNSFSNKILAEPRGVKDVLFNVWEILFDKDDWTNFRGAWKVYGGTGDREEVGTTDVRVGLLAFKHPMQTKYPRRLFTAAFGFNNIPLPNTSFPWGASIATVPPNPFIPVPPPKPPISGDSGTMSNDPLVIR